jgi:ClpX C4-type zinc finger
VRLVAGPSDVYICHLCVAQCAEILALEEPTDRPGSPEPAGPETDRLIRTEVIST